MVTLATQRMTSKGLSLSSSRQLKVKLSNLHILYNSLLLPCQRFVPRLTDNTPDIVVRSLLEGGGATRTVSHRHVLPLLAAHASDTEQPMLLFPKTSLGTLKGLLMRCREPKRGSLVGLEWGEGKKEES